MEIYICFIKQILCNVVYYVSKKIFIIGLSMSHGISTDQTNRGAQALVIGNPTPCHIDRAPLSPLTANTILAWMGRLFLYCGPPLPTMH